MDQRVFGEAGRSLLIRNSCPPRNVGPRLTDASPTVILPIAQDHKKLGEGDTGLNTGGMGAYAPHPSPTAGLQKQISGEVVIPVSRAAQRGNRLRGILNIVSYWQRKVPAFSSSRTGRRSRTQSCCRSSIRR